MQYAKRKALLGARPDMVRVIVYYSGCAGSLSSPGDLSAFRDFKKTGVMPLIGSSLSGKKLTFAKLLKYNTMYPCVLLLKQNNMLLSKYCIVSGINEII